MYTHADKTIKSKFHLFSGTTSLKKEGTNTAQNGLQEMANKSQQVKQLQSYQLMADRFARGQSASGTNSLIIQRKLIIESQSVKNSRITHKSAYKTDFNNHISKAAREKNIAPQAIRNLLVKWAESGDGFLFTSKYEAALKAAELLTHRARVQSRINEFNSNIEDNTSSGQDPKIPSRVDALKNDPNKKDISTLSSEESEGPSMSKDSERKEANLYFSKRKGGIPEEWKEYLSGKTNHGPYKLKTSRFINLFGPETVVMLENYRPPWKKYFASDVFFSQWLSSLGKRQNLSNLPKSFPKYFYRNHIDNDNTRDVLNRLVDDKKSETVIIDRSSKWWTEVAATQNGASTFQIVDEYNKINMSQGGSPYQITSIQIYRDKNKNFALKFLTTKV